MSISHDNDTPVPLYRPLYQLKPIAENIWIADGGITKMHMYGIRIPFSTRMTVVKLNNGDIWCHSPIEPDEGLLSEINRLGEVKHLLSPNKIHYTHIAAWKTHYPNATAWASPGVRERAASQNITVHFDADLSNQPPEAWQEQIVQLLFVGSKFMQEVVFFHKPSRTLILADLIENFETEQMDWFWRWMMTLSGTAAPNGKAPADFRATFFGHKALARQCLQKMLAWQPEKIILAHGTCYEKNAAKELQRAFHWLE